MPGSCPEPASRASGGRVLPFARHSCGSIMIRMYLSGRPSTAVAALVVVGLAASLAGCGGSGGSSSGNGQLSVLMADAPLSLTGVSAVNVTISRVDVHGGSSVDPTGQG